MDDVLDLLLFKFNTDFSNGFSNTKYSCIVFASSIKARLHIPFTMRFLHCILCYVLELLALVITFVNGGVSTRLKACTEVGFVRHLQLFSMDRSRTPSPTKFTPYSSGSDRKSCDKKENTEGEFEFDTGNQNH